MRQPIRSAEALTDRLNAAERDRTHPPIRIRDAATLIVLDPNGPSVLMGRRSTRHAFMPGMLVFPGGRVDPADSRIRVATPFHEATAAKLAAETGSRHGPARMRAFGVAALREAYEETGVLFGRRDPAAVPGSAPFAAFARRGLGLDLGALAFIARAITPPGRPRRFDTRFFLARRDDIADIDETVVGADAELEEIDWVPVSEARSLKLPTITLTVLDELMARLAEDPDLSPQTPVPFYRWRGKGFTRTLL